MATASSNAWGSPVVLISVITLLITILTIGIRNAIVISNFMVRADTCYLTKDEAKDNYLSIQLYAANHKALSDVIMIQLQENNKTLDELSRMMEKRIDSGR